MPRPCVRNVHAQRMSTTIRFEKPIRYAMWMPSHSSQAVKPPCWPNGPIQGMSVTARQPPDDRDVAVVRVAERLRAAGRGSGGG